MEKAQVYFIKLAELGNLKNILPDFSGPLGVKVHFGEKHNNTFVPAKYIKEITQMLASPTLIETSVLYRSLRSNAVGHRSLAIEHGFDFAPIDFLDGEVGDDTIELEISGDHFTKCYLGKNLEKYPSLLVISHFKGHGAAIFGGALKNLGMGLAARRGKLAQHASIPHSVTRERCLGCGQCVSECPVQAISFQADGKVEIDHDKCISCSKCISICSAKAIEIPWASTGTDVLQERIVEYATAALKNRSAFFVNFLINITAECDCVGRPMEKIAPDIGVLASLDPVAIDQASCDLLIENNPDLARFKMGEAQLSHAEKIGLGKRDYELIYL